MSEKIIIDGYNLIRQSEKLLHFESIDLEEGRSQLIQMLCDYKKIKRQKIAVVFDGWKSNNLSQSSYMEKGIRIIFSRSGQKADDVIKRMARESGKELIIVTSDREIKDFAEVSGNVVISSQDFIHKIEMASYLNTKGMTDEDDELDGVNKITTRKKGNPKRLSKSERKKKRHLKKL